MMDFSTLPGHLIRRLHQVSTQVFTAHMRQAGHDLTPVQYAALDALSHNPGIDQAGLAAAIAKDRATIGSVIDRLELKGLVNREIDGRDKRARRLHLSEQGEQVLNAVRPLVEALQADILPGLSAEEYTTFVSLAQKASKAANAIGPD